MTNCVNAVLAEIGGLDARVRLTVTTGSLRRGSRSSTTTMVATAAPAENTRTRSTNRVEAVISRYRQSRFDPSWL